jgi:rhodanese-related sulfurtransferase
MPTQMTPRELAERLDGPTPPVVLDVREPEEIAIASFPGALAIPMAEVPQRLGEVPRDADVVVLCHHGVRSAHVASFLADRGYDRIANLAGGIDAWSLQVDSTVPRY